MIITMKGDMDEEYIVVDAVSDLIDYLFQYEGDINVLDQFIANTIAKYYSDADDRIKEKAEGMLWGAYIGISIFSTLLTDDGKKKLQESLEEEI